MEKRAAMAQTQSRWPTLWRAFQFLIGGTVAKRRLVLRHFHAQRRVLEVGCSLGNIAPAFARTPMQHYLGIDIDPVVIAYAQRSFRHRPRFAFTCQNLCTAPPPREADRYDYVLLAGVLHHIDDAGGRALIAAAARWMTDDGVMVITDPLQPRSDDAWLIRRFIAIEEGAHVRTGAAMRALLADAPGLKLDDAREELVAATPVGFPKVARFGVYRLRGAR
jgi:SAM-dependent methyltransferase